MTSEAGTRAAHKLATRRAIQDAADRLFEDKGYAATTIREIAAAAKVTERTFFRYFAGKEALLVEDIEAWLPTFGLLIRQRPPGERPLQAVEEATLQMAGENRGAMRTNPAWLFLHGPPVSGLGKSAPRLLLRFEEEVAQALLDRQRSNGSADTEQEFTCQVVARCAVAALRSAGIRDWQLRQTDQPGHAPADLIRQAFSLAREM
jgi:AcrR family transcriptional regulator